MIVCTPWRRRDDLSARNFAELHYAKILARLPLDHGSLGMISNCGQDDVYDFHFSAHSFAWKLVSTGHVHQGGFLRIE